MNKVSTSASGLEYISPLIEYIVNGGLLWNTELSTHHVMAFVRTHAHTVSSISKNRIIRIRRHIMPGQTEILA